MVFYFTATGNSLYIAKQIEPDPVSIPQAMRREQLDAELMKGMKSMKSGKTYTADEVDAELSREFGI